MEFAEFSLGGNYFKPEDHKDATAILFEVLRFVPQERSNFGPKDAVYCDITVFGTDYSLESGTPTAVLGDSQVQYKVLVKNLKSSVGKAVIASLTQLPPQNGNRPAWALAGVSKDISSAVQQWAIAHEVALEEAVASAPDFD